MSSRSDASPIRPILLARLAAVAVAVLFFAAWRAPAQPRETPEIPPVDAELQRRFKEADLNRDGTLTRAEAKVAGFKIEEDFGGIDADRNGTVTLVELGQYLANSMRDWAAGADEDGDGRVSAAEAAKKPSLLEIFKTADRDHDGLLSDDEYLAYRRSRVFENVDMPSVVPNIIDKRF